MRQQEERVIGTLALILCATLGTSPTTVFADAVPGGTLDPHSIPKYVTPLVIPPVMNTDGTADKYDIAVRQFRQQILPGGVWAKLSPACSVDPRCDLPATTVWGYGPDADLTPVVAPDPGSQFNYPGYTIETTSHTPVSVRWINELVADPDGCKSAVDPSSDPACNFIPPLLPVDQTLHWANPPATGCRDGSNRSDCATNNPAFYGGPVPIVTHLHGAHVETHSDGYPEAWWLPAANNIPGGYATKGELFDDATGKNPGNLGYADYRYRNDQPATTLWYHDHALGITHTTVYAGLAGFWLIRRGRFDKVWDRVRRRPGTLPGPAPVAGEGVLELNDPHSPVRRSIREIPMVIQDRSFNADGSLFYPDNRAFFEGLEADTLRIPFVPESDIAPIWNPEAFFNTIVVNGVTWPALEVAPARYRFRLLNGCNSRTLNLAMFEVNGDGSLGAEIPFYEIGGDQGFLRRVVRIETGLATPLRGNGALPPLVPASDPQQALLLAPAERADVIVDFSGLPDGTRVRVVNTAPDAPYQGFPDEPADPDTTGQMMELVVSSALRLPRDALTSSPVDLVPRAERRNRAWVSRTRKVSLNEEESDMLCVTEDSDGNIVPVADSLAPDCTNGGEAFGPKEALLGTVIGTGAEAQGNPLNWTDTSGVSHPATVTKVDGSTLTVNVTENPTVGDTEIWEIYNFTDDAHPIHLHLVRFGVVGRTLIDGTPSSHGSPQPWENGFKDTVIAYPGEITRVKVTFDIVGLYVWHCHILEHEDNEMMRPYVVSPRRSRRY